MTELLEKAIGQLKRLPEADQDEIARELLEMLASEQRWNALFTDPRSKKVLAELAAEACEDIERGDVFDYDPATRPKP